MARQLRVEFPSAIYHVTVRMLGNWKKEQNLLFDDDEDRQRFLSSLAERVEQFNIRLYLFSVMSNHFHLLLETPEGNLGRFMHALTTSYTIYFNLRHERHGHLVDGRYKAKLVEGDEYLLALSRYVHLNPVQVGGIKDQPIEEKIRYLRSYPWSSYPSYAGFRKPFDFVEYGPVLAEMPGKQGDQKKRYRKYVETGLAENDEDIKAALKESPKCIGGETFRVWVDELYEKIAEKHNRSEDVAFRQRIKRLSPDVVLDLLAEIFEVKRDEFCCRHRNSAWRAVASRFLCQYAGLTQREVAAVLEMGTGSAVSHQAQKVDMLMAKDRRLSRLVNSANQRLEEFRAKPTRVACPTEVSISKNL